jgi:hypothetical protein
LTEYGRKAGQQFVIRFGDPSMWPPNEAGSSMNWENHQLIRLRLLLAATSETLESLRKGIAATTGTQHDYERFFSLPACGPESYRFKGIGKLAPDPSTGLYTTQAGLSKWTFEQVLSTATSIAKTIAANPGESMHPSFKAPKPTPELKLRPRV